jgi:glycosyltransferase involved in cell wall biosynthesis
MACGKPVIATATGGLTELIADGKNGLLIEQSGEALAAAIARVLDDRELARAMGKAARQTAIGYSWREIGKQTYELYRKISLLR